LQKANASAIRHRVSKLPITTAAVFYDLRAEAQVLLNYTLGAGALVSCIEDGLMLYDVARPFPRSLTRSWKNKLRFGMKWKEARFIGRHPAIDEFRCLYPRMLRDDLRNKPCREIPHTLAAEFQQRFQRLYGCKQYEHPFGIIVLPHPETKIARHDLFEFLEVGISRCASLGIEAVFKVHPRDTVTRSILLSAYPNYRFVSQDYPVELVLYVESRARLLMGFRTSALHVTKALHEYVECLYYEPRRPDPVSLSWRSFFQHLDIRPLGSAPVDVESL